MPEVNLTVLSGTTTNLVFQITDYLGVTVVSGETVDLGLSVPGVQGPIGGDTMPSGGTVGNLLVKQSGINYDAAWVDAVDEGFF
jgi:hypothetical protein